MQAMTRKNGILGKQKLPAPAITSASEIKIQSLSVASECEIHVEWRMIIYTEKLDDDDNDKQMTINIVT